MTTNVCVCVSGVHMAVSTVQQIIILLYYISTFIVLSLCLMKCCMPIL